MSRRLQALAVVGVALDVSGLLASQSSPGIRGVIAPNTPVELVREGYRFTEGPVGAGDGGLYFTDSIPTRIYRVDPSGVVSLFRDNAGDADGLAFDAAGMLYSADRINKTGITRTDPKGVPAPVSTEAAPGRPYMAPNDLILDARGGIYFTDPGLRSAPPLRTYVYYLPPGRAHPIVIDDQMRSPNGLMLSLDGKTLFVVDNVETGIYAFELAADGNATRKRLFARLPNIPPDKDSLGDGMAIDTESRLYVTCLAGVQVFDRAGEYLGTISIPQTPSNVAFAGPQKRTLFVTARQAVYRLQMLSQGPARLGK